MKDIFPFLIRPFVYGIFAVAVTRLIVLDFGQARRRELVHGHAMLPLVTRERVLARIDPWELRARGRMGLMVQGLSFTEMLPEEPGLWRHGLAPATLVAVAPRPNAARLKFAFDNAHRDQAMTIRVGGVAVDQRGPLPVGRVTGDVEIPASAEPLDVEFAFSRWEQPAPDSRKITVTFRELTLILP